MVSIYVGDLIYTGNDDKMIRDFKKCMKEEFDMTDLGQMKYFLDIISDTTHWWDQSVSKEIHV